jgi:Na+/phosphate symporter
MNNNPETKPSNNSDVNIKRDNKGQIINQAEGPVINKQYNYIIRFFTLLSEQALKGSIVGAVIGLSLIFISHTIFYPIVNDYTISAKCAEFICAIFVGLYCRLFCSNHLSRKSQKNFLAALAFVITWFVLPSVRQIFLSIFEAFFDRNTADTISYAMSYAIICVLAGGVIETIAEMLNNSKEKSKP